MSDDSSGGLCGCLIWIGILIVVGTVLFGLCCGVTVGGTTYNCTSCSCDNGLVFGEENPQPREVIKQEDYQPEPQQPPLVPPIEDIQMEEEDLIIGSKQKRIPLFRRPEKREEDDRQSTPSETN